MDQAEDLKRQLAARTAYFNAFQNEQQVWLQYVQVKAQKESGLLDRAIATINQGYQKVVDDHAGTQYATVARVGQPPVPRR